VIGEELDPEKFFRISRGCIMAMRAITSVVKQPGSRLKVVSRPEAPFEMTVSRSRVDDFLAWLER
jgi:DNA-binding LytR/AlgR family response regulator